VPVAGATFPVSDSEDLDLVQNCTLVPIPVESADESGWSVEVAIEEDYGDSITSTPFFLKGRFESERLAIDATLLNAKRIVDEGFTLALLA
jgi:hypothetical protein